MRPSPFYSLLAFVLLSCLIYLPAYQAGYVTDFTGFIPRIAAQGASGILSSYDFPALQPLLNLFFYLLYQLDGTTGPLWYVMFSGLHGVNAFLVFSLCLQVPLAKSWKWFPYLAAGLFLLSPYQTEVVVWRVGLNYLLSTAAVLGSLLLVLRYVQAPNRGKLWAIWLCTAAGWLCFEQTVTAPFLAAALLWALQVRQRRTWLYILGGQLVVMALYFIVLKLSIQQWVGHYGTDVHFAMPWRDMLAAPLRYAGKFAFLSRYWPHDWKADWFALAGQYYVSVPVLLLACGAIVYYLQKTSQRRWLAFFLLAFGLSLLPFLNLYFNFLLWIENDRYGYLAAAFFYPFLLLAMRPLPKHFYLFLVVIFFAVNIYFLAQTLRSWYESNRLYWALLDDYPEADGRPTFLLNLPDNLRGAPMFRDFGRTATAFQTALQTHRHIQPAQPILEIMEYNMTRATDGVQVDRPATDSLVVEFKQWGNWWWRHGIGGGSYETDAFRLREKGHHYELKLKEEGLNARYFWQDGKNWKSVEDISR